LFPVPQNIDKSIHFLSTPLSEQIQNHFSSAFSVLLNNFKELSLDNFSSLPIRIVEKLFFDVNQQISDENMFFHKIIELNKITPKFRTLLKNVRFTHVSPALLKEFFKVFPIDEVDFDLFESLKSRLFLDFSNSNL
jgi:hypothetical protein